MRSQFKGHFEEPKNVIDDIWSNGTFVFDTNVLLNLYRYSDSAKKDFIALLKEIQDRCWLPEQVAHEYFSGRLGVIRDQVVAYNSAKEKIDGLLKSFAVTKGHPFISPKAFDELEAVAKKISREIARNSSAQEKAYRGDSIKEEIATIFDGRVGAPYTTEEMEELFKLGEARYVEEVPPGYRDKNKIKNATRFCDKRTNYGDYILWTQILDKAKSESRNVIFVTDDGKEDWWLEKSNKTISARPELIEEFASKTQQRILIYTPDRFLKYSTEQLGPSKVSDGTIDEVIEEHSARVAKVESAKLKRAQREFIKNKSRNKYFHDKAITRALNSSSRTASYIENLTEKLKFAQIRKDYLLKGIADLNNKLDSAFVRDDQQLVRFLVSEINENNTELKEVENELEKIEIDLMLS